MEDIYYHRELTTGTYASPKGNGVTLTLKDDSIMGRELWRSDPTFEPVERLDLEHEHCHCGVLADFVEITEDGPIFWCSIPEAEAFYYPTNRIP